MSVTISGSGQIIKQVIQTVKTDVYTVSTSTFTSVTGLSVSITPTNANNKILVMLCLNAASNTGASNSAARLMRDSTPIFLGDAAGSKQRASFEFFNNSGENIFALNATYLDSPATTSAVTYTVQVMSGTAAITYVNRSAFDRDSTLYDDRVPSSITVMEVAYA